MIYLDNAATTMQKPLQVTDAVVKAMQSAGNSGRAAHESALEASRKIYNARKLLAQLFNAEGADNIAFTANSTQALNIAIKGILNSGDHVITTQLEHNSVLRPLYEMENAGAAISFVQSDKYGRIDCNDFEKLIIPATKAIVCTHASNLTGNVVDIKSIGEIAAKMLNCETHEVEFKNNAVYKLDGSASISAYAISYRAQNFNLTGVQSTVSHSSPYSPPPFMVGMVEVEVDTLTGKVDLLDYVAVVDCGTPINPNLVKVQTEGGLVQGIGMALSEGVTYTDKGRIIENSFMQYKLPTRVDISRIRVFFESSWEPTGPFGAKSVGEIVINTPSPAIAHAIYRATGTWHRELPITPEKVWRGVKN